MVASGIAGLRAAGVSQLAVMALANTRLAVSEAWALVPEGFDYFGDPSYNETDDLLQFNVENDGVIFPMLDTRCMVGDVAQQLPDYVARGFRGIKGLYLADDGNDLRVGSIPQVHGISLDDYHRREWEVFAFAEFNGLPVLYHMDANRYGDVMQGILDDFPGLRINFPHFGIGRKAFSRILDSYPNVYTDIAYMAPHIRNNPQSYYDFICHYPDRICFGSDALLYQPEIVSDYIDLVRSLKLPEDVQSKVFSSNPRRFLGLESGSAESLPA